MICTVQVLYNRVPEVTDRESVLHQKRPKVTLLKKLLLIANIISTLDTLRRDLKATKKLVIGR